MLISFGVGSWPHLNLMFNFASDIRGQMCPVNHVKKSYKSREPNRQTLFQIWHDGLGENSAAAHHGL